MWLPLLVAGRAVWWPGRRPRAGATGGAPTPPPPGTACCTRVRHDSQTPPQGGEGGGAEVSATRRRGHTAKAVRAFFSFLFSFSLDAVRCQHIMQSPARGARCGPHGGGGGWGARGRFLSDAHISTYPPLCGRMAHTAAGCRSTARGRGGRRVVAAHGERCERPCVNGCAVAVLVAR